MSSRSMTLFIKKVFFSNRPLPLYVLYFTIRKYFKLTLVCFVCVYVLLTINILLNTYKKGCKD